MPYAMLSEAVPAQKIGVGMGVFNMFVVLPQILAALSGIVWLNDLLFQGVVQTMVLAGIGLFVAAVQFDAAGGGSVIGRGSLGLRCTLPKDVPLT